MKNIGSLDDDDDDDKSFYFRSISIQKAQPYQSVQLYDSAQNPNIFIFEIVSILLEIELNWSNNMCFD